MRRLTNILGLLFLTYFAYNYRNWHIGIRDDNILSTMIVKPIQWLPNWIIFVVLISFILIYIKEIIYNDKSFMLHIISLGLITLVSKICISILMLEDISYFTFFYVEHTVPIELKLLHFKNTLSSALESIPQEQLQHMINLLGNNILNQKLYLNVISDIKNMNATEIRVYTQELLNNMEAKCNLIVSTHLKYIGMALTISGVIIKYFT